MKDPMSVQVLIVAIRALPADSPVDDPRKSYLTQKQHWIGWLSEYGGPGAYGRQIRLKRDAQYAYNHIVEPKMLVYLAEASGVRKRLVSAAKQILAKRQTFMQKSAAIRAIIPWQTVALALWKNYEEEDGQVNRGTKHGRSGPLHAPSARKR